MRSIGNPLPPGDGYHLVHTRTIRLRSGRVLRAQTYGLRCFTFWAKDR
jgi:hypothetical protein